MLETRFLPSGFGSIGYVLTNQLGAGRAVVLQPDGKILAAAQNGGSAFGLVRYNSDGTLDTSFNGTGIVLTPFSGAHRAQSGAAYALALQSDGKIIEAGNFFANPGDRDAALARFNTNGTLDTTFGTGGRKTGPTGKVTTDFGATDDSIQGLAVQPLDAKIVAVGISNGQMEVARYNTDGSLDSTFGSGGLVSAAGTGGGTGMALQADGKIVASADIGTQFEVVRFNTNGTLDTSFGGAGIVTTAIGSDTSANTYAIAIYPNAGTVNDGKIVAVGHGSSTAGGTTWVIARYNPDGSLDSTFGTGGIVQSNHTGNYVSAYAVAIQSDGKIVVTGKHYVGDGRDEFAVDRFNTDGSLDTTFGSGGIVVTPVSPSGISVGVGNSRGVALQTNGQIVVAGDFFDGTNIDLFVARYNTNGTLDPVTSGGGDSTSSSDSADSDAGRFFLPPNSGHSDFPTPATSTDDFHRANHFEMAHRLVADDSSSQGRHDFVSHSGRMASGSTHALWSDLDADLLFPTFNIGTVGVQP
jgi:uncharacterized delta-60 repeat protein